MGKQVAVKKDENEEVNLEEELNEEENLDATDDDKDTEDKNDESVEEEDSDSDEGTGDEEDAGDDSEASGEDEEAEEVDPRDERIAKLEAEIEAIKTGAKKEEPQAPVKKQYTPEEIASIEERSGMDFRSVQFVEGMLQNMVGKIKEYVEGNLSGFKKTSAIDKLSKQKGFEDAKKYEKGIDEFLSNFSPQMHSNERILKMAYTYGKGLGINNTIKKVIANKDKNKKIVGKARPSGGNKPSSKSSGLSDEEKTAARMAGMSEAEYQKYKNPLRTIK